MIGGDEEECDEYYGNKIEMIILLEERELLGYLAKFKKSEFISLIFALLKEIKRLIRAQKKRR